MRGEHDPLGQASKGNARTPSKNMRNPIGARPPSRSWPPRCRIRKHALDQGLPSATFGCSTTLQDFLRYVQKAKLHQSDAKGLRTDLVPFRYVLQDRAERSLVGEIKRREGRQVLFEHPVGHQ